MPRTIDVEVHLKLKAGNQQIDEAAIEQIKYLPGVQRDIHRRAGNVADYMREHVGVKTGQLRGTIRTEDDGPAVNVMAGRAGQTPQLGYQMEGTRPHEIRPRSENGMLRFFWEKVGQNVAFKKVSHPGGKKNDFVRESIRAAAP